jgi:hypothetical protein
METDAVGPAQTTSSPSRHVPDTHKAIQSAQSIVTVAANASLCEDEEITQLTRNTADFLAAGGACILWSDGSYWRIMKEAVVCVELVQPGSSHNGNCLRTYADEVVVALCSWEINKNCKLTPLRCESGPIQEKRGKRRHLVPLIELSKCENCEPAEECHLLTPILMDLAPIKQHGGSLPPWDHVNLSAQAISDPSGRRFVLPMPCTPNASLPPFRPNVIDPRCASSFTECFQASLHAMVPATLALLASVNPKSPNVASLCL